MPDDLSKNSIIHPAFISQYIVPQMGEGAKISSMAILLSMGCPSNLLPEYCIRIDSFFEYGTVGHLRSLFLPILLKLCLWAHGY